MDKLRRVTVIEGKGKKNKKKDNEFERRKRKFEWLGGICEL